MDFLIRTNANEEAIKTAFKDVFLPRPSLTDNFKLFDKDAQARKMGRWGMVQIEDADIAAELEYSTFGLQLREGCIFAGKIIRNSSETSLQTWFAIGMEWVGFDTSKGYLKFYTQQIGRKLEAADYAVSMDKLK